jgi:hypothetical protein
MYLAVIGVKPLNDYNLMLTFENGERRQFDMKPFMSKGIFRELNDIEKFNTVRVAFDTIEWDNEADFDPEILYKYSKIIE